MASFIPSELFAGIGGNREIKDGYARIDGAWRKIFSGVNWTWYQYANYTSGSSSATAEHSVTAEGHLFFNATANSNAYEVTASAGSGMHIPVAGASTITAYVDNYRWYGSHYSESGAWIEYYQANGTRISRWIVNSFDSETSTYNYRNNTTYSNLEWTFTTPANTAYILFYAGGFARERDTGGARMTVKAIRINGIEQTLT